MCQSWGCTVTEAAVKDKDLGLEMAPVASEFSGVMCAEGACPWPPGYSPHPSGGGAEMSERKEEHCLSAVLWYNIQSSHPDPFLFSFWKKRSNSR